MSVYCLIFFLWTKNPFLAQSVFCHNFCVFFVTLAIVIDSFLLPVCPKRALQIERSKEEKRTAMQNRYEFHLVSSRLNHFWLPNLKRHIYQSWSESFFSPNIMRVNIQDIMNAERSIRNKRCRIVYFEFRSKSIRHVFALLFGCKETNQHVTTSAIVEIIKNRIEFGLLIFWIIACLSFCQKKK